MTTAAKPWQILSGFAVSGLLLALPGALLPLWDFHIKLDFGAAGNLFLALGLGAILGNIICRRLDVRFPPSRVLSVSCIGSALSLLLLSVAGPPVPKWLENIVMGIVGVAAGAVNTAILEAISPWYEQDPAGISLLAGSFFGVGSFAAALLLSQTLEAVSPPRWIAIAAVFPTTVAIAFWRLPTRRADLVERSRAHLLEALALEELKSPLAIFFALLLFFQFGSEWAIAGWLPVYLIDRLGLSPSSGLRLLAFYWFALTGGRILVSSLLTRIHHGRLLALSAFCALFGCVVLLAATNLFGVVCGLAFTGAGFSAIYPLCAERIGKRFSSYHPAYFNGIFSFALLGGTMSPWVLGHLAAGASLQIVPVAVMVSSCVVFALILLIWLGNKVSGN